MDPSFTPVAVTPSKTPFGLDQLMRTFKTSLSAESAIAAAPAVGTVDETFPFMFLMPISAPESSESATKIDLVYMGCLMDDGEGGPLLPDQKHDSDDAVQSATSSKGNAGQTATPPITVQFYAPTNSLTYFSYLAAGSAVAADPSADIKVITLTIADLTLFVGDGTANGILTAFFSVQIIETHQSTEVVPGKFWQNTSKKVKSYSPFIVSLTPGPYMVIHFVGTGYTVGNTLTVTAGGESASCTVDTVGGSGNVEGYTVTSDTFTVVQANLSATGGSGSGASFDIFIVT